MHAHLQSFHPLMSQVLLLLVTAAYSYFLLPLFFLIYLGFSVGAHFCVYISEVSKWGLKVLRFRLWLYGKEQESLLCCLWLESMVVMRKQEMEGYNEERVDCRCDLWWTSGTPSLFTLFAVLATYPLGQTRTHAGDLAHFDVTDSMSLKNREGKEQQLQRWS